MKNECKKNQRFPSTRFHFDATKMDIFPADKCKNDSGLVEIGITIFLFFFSIKNREFNN